MMGEEKEKGGNAIMIALGKAKDKSSSDLGDDESDDIEVSSDEMDAAKVLGFDETKAKALKAFVKLCGGY